MRELQDVTRIEVDPDRLSGRPTIRGRRVPVEKVAELAESSDGLRDPARGLRAEPRGDP